MTSKMKSCYKHYEGCHVKGLPIGTPFRSQFFIPKSKRSKIQENVEVFILLRLNSYWDGVDNKLKYPGKGINFTEEAVNAVEDSSNISGVTDLEKGVNLKQSIELTDKSECHRHGAESGSLSEVTNDDSLKEITTMLFGADILKDLNTLELVDLCKGVNVKCDKKQEKTQERKRENNSQEVLLDIPAKKVKIIENDEEKVTRKGLRLRTARPDYRAIEKGSDAFSDIVSDTDDSEQEADHSDPQLASIKESKDEDFLMNVDKDNEIASSESDTNQVDNVKEEFDHKTSKLVIRGNKKRGRKKHREKNTDKNQEISIDDSFGENSEGLDVKENSKLIKEENADKDSLSDTLSESFDTVKKKSKSWKGKTRTKIKGEDGEACDPELIGLSMQEKSRVMRQRKKIEKESKRIKVKLEDHPDKYRKDLMDSFARKDRGKSRSECAIEIFVCTVCEKFKAKSPDAMETHIECHVNGELHCTECPYIAPFVNNLTKHKREVHKRNVTICFECGVETTGSDGLKDHLGKVHGKPQYKCKHCLKEKNEQFAAATKNQYRQHLRKFHSEKMAACQTCSRLFANQTMLTRHMELGCAGDTPSYACEKCGKTYTSQDRVNDHVKRVHNKVRRFQCPHCPFTAARGAGLNQHLHIHTGYHPFKCDQCTFTCVQKYQLTSHMRTHTGDKPYKCNQCNYAAAWNVQLKDHTKVHGMINTILCDLCNVMFKDVRTFKTHQSKEHPLETHKAKQTMKPDPDPRRQAIDVQQVQHIMEAYQVRQAMEMQQVRQPMEAPSYITM